MSKVISIDEIYAAQNAELPAQVDNDDIPDDYRQKYEEFVSSLRDEDDLSMYNYFIAEPGVTVEKLMQVHQILYPEDSHEDERSICFLLGRFTGGLNIYERLNVIEQDFLDLINLGIHTIRDVKSIIIKVDPIETKLVSGGDQVMFVYRILGCLGEYEDEIDRELLESLESKKDPKIIFIRDYLWEQ